MPACQACPFLYGSRKCGRRSLHYVVAEFASSDKAPIASGWLDAPASAADVAAARSEPYLVLGHIPFAAGLLVVDIDTDKGQPVDVLAEAVRDSLGAPLCEVRTRSGGLHLYYRCDRPVGNRKWEGGDIRVAPPVTRSCGMRTRCWRLLRIWRTWRPWTWRHGRSPT